jgi:hypothetical protein
MIVQVIGIQPERQKTFEQARAEIEEALIFYHQQSVLMKQISDWRQNYAITIDSLGLGRVPSPLAARH